MLDRDQPEQVLYRSKEQVLAPKEDYERFGKVPNVVFSCGNLILEIAFLFIMGQPIVFFVLPPSV